MIARSARFYAPRPERLAAMTLPNVPLVCLRTEKRTRSRLKASSWLCLFNNTSIARSAFRRALEAPAAAARKA